MKPGLDDENRWLEIVRVLSTAPTLSELINARVGYRTTGSSVNNGSSFDFSQGKRTTKHSPNEWIVPGITSIQRIDPENIIVSWSDATHGHYSDQTWFLSAARHRDVCAISGAQIYRGDSIFRPRGNRTHRPVNSDTLILASCVDTLIKALHPTDVAFQLDVSKERKTAYKQSAR